LFPKSIEEAIMPSLQRVSNNDGDSTAPDTTFKPPQTLALQISGRWILYHRHRHKQLGVENPGILSEELCEFNPSLKFLLNLVTD
jgi:hypothetical protein